MNLTKEEGNSLVAEVLDGLKNGVANDAVEVVFAPPFPFLDGTSSIVNNSSNASVAAQNCHQSEAGAFTGEVSAKQIKAFGASSVILGHSERRQYFGEDDELIGTKMQTAFAVGLEVIYCCGETLEDRQSGNQEAIVRGQITQAFAQVSKWELESVIIAYEPVWAIGTGETATPDQVDEMHNFIVSVIEEMYQDTEVEVPVLYGGSVKPNNAKELFALKNVSGGLIGGASLNSQDFLSIISAFE